MKNKRFDKIIITPLLILACLALFNSCGGDDEPTEQDLAFEKLSGYWNLVSITVDGQPVERNYENFSLSFTETTYNTQNAGSLLSASGTWSWVNETTTNQIILEDGKTISIQSLTETSFRFSFQESGGPVRSGIDGNYVIEMEK